MANFGWAYINCSDSGSMDGGSRGPTGAIQFYSGAGISTGSSRFIFSGSESGSYTLFLTGTLKISGAISASSFVVDTIHHIDATGSTFFGDTSDDVHIRTGSLHMSNGAYIIGPLSASSTFHTVNHGTFGATIESSGSILTKGGLFSHAEVSASGQLEAVGATRLGSTLAVSGAMTSVASITSSATIEAGSHISGGATLQAVGATILGSSLAVSGASSLQALSASAYSGSYTFHTQEAATFGSTLTSTGSATFKSIVIGSSVNNTIGHVDDVDLVTLTNRTITLSADSILSGSQLSASRDVSVVGSITGSANLAISGNSIFAGNITVGGAIIGGSPVHVSGGLVISGSDGSVTYIGSGSTGGTAFPASATVTGSLLVSGSTTITGSLTVTGSSTIYNYGSFVNYILDPTVPRETRSFFVQGSDGFVSGSNNLEIVGTMKSIGSITTSGSIDGGGDLTMNTITMTGFGVTNDGTTSVKSLKVDDNSTVGSDSDPDLLTIAGDGNLQIKGNISASGTSHTVGISTFSSTISATGSISGSHALSVVNSITSSANIAASGSLVIGEGEWLGIPDRENVIQLNDGNIIVDGVIFAQNSISGSQQLQVVGASILGNTLTVSGNVTTAGDIILDDGGSIKEGGGVAAITIDGSGNITKLGQSTHSTNDVLTWDGAKWVATADASHTSLSGTTAELTTGVETSGYLKVSGSSTLGVITGTTYSGSSTLHAVGAATFGSTVASSGSVTSAGLVSSGLISGSGALMIMSVAQFGSNAEVTGALSVGGTLVGAHANGTISSSAGITNVGSITSSANIAASGSLVLGMGSFVGAHGGKENLIQLNDGHVLVNGALFVTDGISGSNIMHNVGAATFSSTLAVSGNITTVGDLILDDGGSIKEGGGTAAITIDGSGNVTKIGQDTPSNNEVLTYDGAKWVASAVGGGTATSVSGTTAELTTGVETSGYLKVSGSSTLAGLLSSSAGLMLMGAGEFGSNVFVTGNVSATNVSGSGTLESVGAAVLGSTLVVSGNVTTAGDLILDDGGSIKEGGGTAAITIDGSGNVTKIGQDTPSTNEVLTYDGAKWVASAAAGGAATSVSGTTAELTTGVETSGYLKVSGSSTLAGITATTYSGSSTAHIVGATTLSSTLAVTGAISGSSTLSVVGNMSSEGALTLSGNIDSGGDLTAATITMAGFVVDADGDTALKSLAVDDGSTIGCDSDTDLLTLAAGALSVAGTVSGSSTLEAVGATRLGSTLAVSGAASVVGAISGSSTLEAVGGAILGSTLTVSGNVTTAGDIILDDGGSLKEGGGVAAFSFDGSGNVTKIGQDTPSNNEVLTYDGAKWVASAAGSVTSISGTTAELTTGVETSGYLKVSGSSTLTDVTATTYSGSSTMHVVGATTLGSTLALSGNIDSGGDLTAATITMTGFVVDADGDTALKSLAVDDGSTIGCDSDTDLLTLASGALLIKGNVSGSGTSIQAGAASFSSTVAATGSVTAAGLNSTGLISGSSAITVVGNATFTGNLNASGSLSLQGTEPRVMFTGSDGTALGQVGFNASNNILIQNNFNNKHIVFKATDNSVVKEGLRLDGSVPEVVVNQNGASGDNNTLVDFRVESDNNTHMLYVQGSTDKVGINTNAPLQAFSVVGGISGSSTLHAVGAATLGSTLSLTGAISAGGPLTGPHAVGTLSSSAGLTTVGAVVLGSTLIASGNITTAGDLILDDGGSIKEGGGTAAITIDGAGHVTKIGQDSPSNGEVLTYDGAKWVASAAGSVTSLSGTTAELTTRIETSGFLKVSGNIDTAGDLTAATITMTGFVVDADGDTALKSLAVDDGSTIGCDSDTDLLTLVQNALLLKGALSSSGTSIQAGTADFSSTVAASGSITSVGVNNTGIYSGSSTMNVIGEATFGAAVLATGSVVAHTLTASAGGVGLGNLIDAEIAGADQAGTNVAGKNLIIRPSNGTGNGAPAFVEIQAPVPGSSGTAVQTASPVIHIAGEGPKFFYNSVTTLLDDEGTGEILRMGTGTTTAGKLYFLHSGSAWFEADANIEQSGSAMLLAIALGSNPVNNGMLVKGFFDVNTYFTGAFPVGQQVYMSDAAGRVSGYRLSGSGEVVRVIGHATTQTNVIYFNPSVDFLVL